MERLSAKQEKFCIEIAKGENQTQAALNAGYSPAIARRIGSDNMTKENIKTRIKELSQREKTRRIMSIDERQELLSNIALDEEADKNTRIKAVDTLNKMDGVYITKAEVKIRKSLSDIIKEVDEEEC